MAGQSVHSGRAAVASGAGSGQKRSILGPAHERHLSDAQLRRTDPMNLYTAASAVVDGPAITVKR